jgi:hypothetical protein
MIASPIFGISSGLAAGHWILCGAGILLFLAAPWIPAGWPSWTR